MKVQTARIKIVLWTSKVLSDGTSPILLQVSFYGTTRMSTHFSCKPKDWNEKDECLKKSFPNYLCINKMLQDTKNKAIAAKLNFETSGIPYTSKMIIEAMKPKETNVNKLNFLTVMEQLFDERHLRSATIGMYQSVFNILSNFIGKKDFIITEITNDVLINFAKSVNESTHCSNTVLAYISKVISVINFANDNELTDFFPKKGNEWVNSNFKKTVHHKALNEEDFYKITNYYCSIDKSRIMARTSKEFAVAFYLGCYSMFGIAPVDGAKLKLNCFESVTLKGIECWKINTVRSKTNQPLNIIVMKESFGGRLLNTFIETANERDGYIFPILQDNEMAKEYKTEKQVTRIINYTEGIVNGHLKDVAREIGIPEFTLYSMRHSFASHKIKEGASVSVIANALGRSVSGIGCYIAALEKDEDFLKIATL